MAQTIKLKRSATQGAVPTTSNLALGELAINTYDGKIFIKKNDGSESIVTIGALADNAVTSAKIAANAVTSSEVAANAIGTSEIAANSVGISELNVSDGSNGQVLTTDGSGTLSFTSKSASSQSFYLNTATGDGSTTAFTLSTTPASESYIIAFIDGVFQNQDSYTFSGTTLTFDTAPANGTTVTVYVVGSIYSGNSVVLDTFSGDNSETAFTLSEDPQSENNTQVYIDGVYQQKSEYSVSGQTITFSSAPPTGTNNIEVIAFTSTNLTVLNANSVTSASIASGAVNTSDIADNAITSAKIASGVIVASDVADNSITSAKIALNAVGASELASGALNGQTFTGDSEITGEFTANEFIGDLRGAQIFKAQAGENLTLGQVVYISGISGNTTVVSLADADDATKMPAFGIVAATTTFGQPVDIYTSGILGGLDTSAYSEGDELFVSTTAGALTDTAPTGETAALQKIAKVTRSNNLSGSIFITGAGRTNAVPNLDEDQFFLGNASNQAVATDFSDAVEALSINNVVEDTTPQLGGNLDLNSNNITGTGNIDITGNITTTGYLAGPSTFTIDPAAVGDNTGTVVIAGNFQVDGTTTTVNSTTITVDDKLLTLASGSINAAAADGGGIEIDITGSTNPSILYDGTNDEWDFNKDINVTGTVTADGLIVETTTPVIDVLANANEDASLRLRENGTGVVGAEFTYDGGDNQLYLKVGNNTNTKRLSVSRDTGDISFYEDTGTTAKFQWLANFERLVLSTSGAYALDVRASATTSATIAQFSNSNGSDKAAIRLDAQGDGELVLIDAGNNEDVVISAGGDSYFNGGNVGIGTSSPSRLLDIENSTAAGSTLVSLVSATDGNVQILMGDTASDTQGKVFYDNVNDFMSLHANGAERLRIDSSGNVGIGTTSPSAPLHVAGNIQTDNIYRGYDSVSGNYRNLLGYDAGNVKIQTGTGSSAYGVSIFTAGTERFHIDGSGNVGIGTSSPSEKLHVNSRAKIGNITLAGNSTNSIISAGNGQIKVSTLEIRGGAGGLDFDVLLAITGGIQRVFQVEAAGTGDTYTNDGTVSSLSDERVKTDIQDLTDGLEIVKQLRPVTFKYNDTTKDEEGNRDFAYQSDKIRYGFIAQEVEAVAPQYVEYSTRKINNEEVDDFRNLSTTRMLPMLFKAIQELNAKLEAAEARITELENA